MEASDRSDGIFGCPSVERKEIVSILLFFQHELTIEEKPFTVLSGRDVELAHLLIKDRTINRQWNHKQIHKNEVFLDCQLYGIYISENSIHLTDISEQIFSGVFVQKIFFLRLPSFYYFLRVVDLYSPVFSIDGQIKRIKRLGDRYTQFVYETFGSMAIDKEMFAGIQQAIFIKLFRCKPFYDDIEKQLNVCFRITHTLAIDKLSVSANSEQHRMSCR